ncbi:MAG: flagellin lysine-N-methylase [Clostridia bacterium]|nr:flagellin lysine-N-methylase [Clostridia bacterium]
MIIRSLVLYDRFKCAGSACRDTCCVRDKLVLDNKTYFEYQRVISKGDAFGRRMVASISERNGVASFRMRENGECPFLMRNHLCELQIRLGADKIAETCRKYPTFSKEYGNYREIGCSFSCPEVLRLVLTHPERFEVRERENDTEPVTYDNLDAELLEAIYPVRNRFLEIAQDRRNTLRKTANVLLKLASAVQNAIDRKAYWELASLIAPFESDDPTGGIKGETPDSEIREVLFTKLLHLHCKLEYKKQEHAVLLGRAYKIIKSETPEERRDRELGFAWHMNHRVYEYRKWLFYQFHRDLLDAVFDGKFYPRVRFAVLTTLCLFELGSLEWKSRGKKFPPQSQEELFRNYAREIDENPKNHARLYQKMNGSAYALPKLLHALANPVAETADTAPEDAPDAAPEETLEGAPTETVESIPTETTENEPEKIPESAPEQTTAE